MEKIGYVLLSILALFWLGAMVFGFINSLPLGILGFIGIAGFGILLIKVIKERLENEEDDYYSKNVDK
ncbi:MAG: hypothetical protein ACQEQC_03870 [Elusimicrobiota bacterium]